jgi:two-component system cell cycle response regulator
LTSIGSRRAVGDVLRRSVRADDHLARVGGDEFVCVMVREDGNSIVHEGRRLLDEISTIDLAVALACPTVERITASAGVTWVRPGAKLATLLNEADMAVYAAKNAGRNRVVASRDLAEAAAASSRDLNLLHFENSTRLATERFADMIALRSRKLLNAATLEANTCPVTGLYSRAYLNTRLGREMAEARSRGRTLAIAFIDVDHFKAINATFGWPSGDRVLRAFADVVRRNLRSSDWAAKYGGDEFLLVFPDSALPTAEHVVERVREAFASLRVESVDGLPVTATLSAGVALMPEREVSAEAFLNDVSKSLNKAKEFGRNRVQSIVQLFPV